MYQKRNIELEIISLYRGNYKRRFFLREISRIAGIPLRTVQTMLIKLEKEKVLKSSIEGKNKYFSLNLENIKAKSIMLQAEIYKTDLFLEKYQLFKTFLKSIDNNSLILVFGSFAKFSSDKDSDLDLLVVSSKEKPVSFHLLPYKIHKINLPESSFIKLVKEQENIMKEIEENHIILNNHSLYVNVIWNNYGK